MRKMSSERRAHLSDAARAQQARRIPGQVMWTPNRIQQIQAAFAGGGRRGALAAFPEMRPSQITAAIRRYCSGPSGAPTGNAATLTAGRSAPSCWADPDFHRRFLEALSGRTQMRTQS